MANYDQYDGWMDGDYNWIYWHQAGHFQIYNDSHYNCMTGQIKYFVLHMPAWMLYGHPTERHKI